MLICSSNFKQFNQGVNEKLSQPHPRWLKGLYETNKGMQNETQTTSKWNQIKHETNFKKKKNQGKTQEKKTLTKIKQPN